MLDLVFTINLHLLQHFTVGRGIFLLALIGGDQGNGYITTAIYHGLAARAQEPPGSTAGRVRRGQELDGEEGRANPRNDLSACLLRARMTFWAWCLSAMEHTRSPNLLMRSKWKWRKSHLRCTRRDTQGDTRQNTSQWPLGGEHCALGPRLVRTPAFWHMSVYLM